MDLIQFMLILAIVGAIAYCIWRWVPMPPAFKTGFLWFVGIAVEGTPEELINRIPGCANLEDVFIALTGRNLRD